MCLFKEDRIVCDAYCPSPHVCMISVSNEIKCHDEAYVVQNKESGCFLGFVKEDYSGIVEVNDACLATIYFEDDLALYFADLCSRITGEYAYQVKKINEFFKIVGTMNEEEISEKLREY